MMGEGRDADEIGDEVDNDVVGCRCKWAVVQAGGGLFVL